MAERFLFLAHRRMVGINVPDEPHFDTIETTRWFLRQLGNAARYLEWGTGGSTYAAAKLGVDFVAVDSDRDFLDAVRDKISRGGYARTGQVFRHVDIGPTGPWGRPVAGAPVELFRSYSDLPPECLEGPLPDLMLVDGRFRVACALKALYWHLLRGDSGWQIVVDDYADRPAYEVLTKFAEMRRVGRMAVLTGLKQQFALDALVEAIETWETVRD